jgi:hypothetical protein
MQAALRLYLAKLGWKWAGQMMWGPDAVEPFLEVVLKACAWGERLRQDENKKLSAKTLEN